MDTINGCNMAEGKMPNYEIGRKRKTPKSTGTKQAPLEFMFQQLPNLYSRL